MNRNILDSERIVRFISGAVITSLAFWGPMNNWFLLGLIPMFTTIFGICPVYALFSYSNRSRKHY